MKSAVGILGLGLTAALTPSDAAAGCTRAGNVVTCSGPNFDSFVTTDRVDMTVQGDGIVANIPIADNNGSCPLSFPAIVVGNGSRIVNLGFVIGTGACASGIDTGNDSLVINRGSIETFNEVGHGIIAGDNSTVTHAGRLTTRGQSGFGILTGTNGIITTETGSTLVTEGPGAPGIFGYEGASIVARGAISTRGEFGNGIEVFGGGTVDQRGTVTTTGLGSTGIRVFGGSGRVDNSGTVVATTLSVPRNLSQVPGGVDVDGPFVEIVNSGTVIGQRYGVRARDFSTATITNTGTISAEADPTFALDAAAVALGGPGEATIDNFGEIRAVGGIAAIRGGDGADRLTNAGIITGDIRLGGGGDFYIVTNGARTEGTIDLGAGSDTVAVIGTARLAMPFSGVELLNKLNPGTLTIDGDIRVDNRAQVVAGTMHVNAGGRLSAPTIAAVGGGILAGSGTFQGDVVNLGNLLATPGARPQIVGSYTQASDGRLDATLTLGGPAPMAVAGPVVLAGILSPTYANTTGPRAGDRYALIRLETPGAGVTGRFDSIDGLTPYFFAGETALSADGGALELRIVRRSYATATETPAQREVAAALDGALARDAGGLKPIYDAIDPLTADAARAVFDTLAPRAPVAAFAGADLSWRATEAALGQWLELGPSDGVPHSIRVWGQAGHRGGTSRTDDPSEKFSTDTMTTIAGIDYALDDGTRVGFALASSDTAARLIAGGARADATYTYGAVYAGRAWSKVRLAGAVMFGDGEPRVVREGLFAPLASRTDVDLGGTFATLTYAGGFGPFIVKPSLSLRVDRTRIGSLNETGSDGLVTGDRSRWSVRPEAGIRLVGRPGRIHPYFALTAAYDMNGSDHDLRARFTAEPTTTFDLLGPEPRRLWVGTQAGVNIELASGLMARFGFDGVVNDSLGGSGFTAGLSYRW